MKSSDIDIAYEYGVVPSWSYSNRRGRDPLSCTRNNVLKTRIVSMVKYQYGVWRTAEEFSPNFVKTNATKGFGYKVESGGTFWVARPQDIIAPWGVLEQRWAKEEAVQKQQFEAESQRRAREEEMQREAQTYAKDAEQRIVDNLAAILKRKCYLSVYTTLDRNTNTFTSTATMDLKVLDALVERVLDLVEA